MESAWLYMNYLQNICYTHCTLLLYQSQLRPNLRGRGRDLISWWVECWRICVHGYKSITLLFLRAYLFLLVCSFWFRSANLFLATRQSTNISKKHTPSPIKLCSESSILLTSIQISCWPSLNILTSSPSILLGILKARLSLSSSLGNVFPGSWLPAPLV